MKDVKIKEELTTEKPIDKKVQPINENNLQHKRANILEKHIEIKSKELNSPDFIIAKTTIDTPIVLDEKDKEILRLKKQIDEFKRASAIYNKPENQQLQPGSVLEKLLPDFLHEISSPLSSIEYSSENIASEYQKILTSFSVLISSGETSQVATRALNYVNKLTSENNFTSEIVDFREKKKLFNSELVKYNIKNSQRAADYFVSAGVVSMDEELHWIISQPNGELYFQLMVSLICVKQSFSVLESAKNRSRYLITTLKNYTNKLPDNYNEQFDLKASLETAIVLLFPKLRALNFVFRYDTKCFIKGNIQHIVHVWINLLSNAIEATNGTGDIILKAFKEEEDVLISIQDNGSGIPPEIISKIFTPYFTTKKQTGGTGIGLDICKNFIDALGGTITVTSQPGKTIFTVRIKKYATERE